MASYDSISGRTPNAIMRPQDVCIDLLHRRSNSKNNSHDASIIYRCGSSDEVQIADYTQYRKVPVQ